MTGLSNTQMLVIGIFALGIVSMLLMIALVLKRLVKHLRANHPEIWKLLERPGSLSEPRSGLSAILPYVVSFRYRDANDPAVKSMGNNIFMFAFVILADVWMIFFILVHDTFR
jgi:hypothetical protein